MSKLKLYYGTEAEIKNITNNPANEGALFYDTTNNRFSKLQTATQLLDIADNSELQAEFEQLKQNAVFNNIEVTGILELSNSPDNPETYTSTSSYTTRQTANGLATVVDNSVAVVKELRGKTVRDAEGLKHAKVTSIKGVGKNICDIYGFSANTINSKESLRELTNIKWVHGVQKGYGTTISTTDAGNSISVTQSQFTTDVDYQTHYMNGYFCVGVDQTLADDTEVVVSFDILITNKPEDMPEDWTSMALMINGISAASFQMPELDVPTRISVKTKWKNYDSRQYVEIRNVGCDAIYSNFQIELGDTATEYTPYIENSIDIPEPVQALDGYGVGIDEEVYNYIDFEKKQFIRKVGCVDLSELDWEERDSAFFATVPNMLSYAKFICSADLDKYGIRCVNNMYDTPVVMCETSDFNINSLFYYQLSEPEVIDIVDILPNTYTVWSRGLEKIINENDVYGALATAVQTYSIHENPKEAATKAYVNNGLATKLDKVGGTITGSLVVEGGTDTDLSALVVKNNSTTYGLTYDDTDEAFKLGKGSVDSDNNFLFDENEGLPIALRDDSTEFTDGNIIQWSAEGNKLVDSGYSIKNITDTIVESEVITELSNDVSELSETIGTVVNDIEELKEIVNGENGPQINETGEVVELNNVEEGTPLSVISKIHRDETWSLSNQLVLHQVSGNNFVDFASVLGGAGTVFSKDGLTATINEDDTVTIKGTNESSSWSYILNYSSYDNEFAQRIYPAGTYTIPSNFMLQVRAAQYPGKVSIAGASGNLSNTVTIPEPFRIVSLVYAVRGNATIDVTLPLGLFRGSSIPQSGYEYCGNTYMVSFTESIYDGEFNWESGELKNTENQTIGYFNSHDIKSLPGTNYFWTGFGENIVANGSNELGRVGLQLNDIAPEETIPTICDYTFIPTTKKGAYALIHSKFGAVGKFSGTEVPVLTTKGTLSVKDAEGHVKHSKYIDPMFNYEGVSDILTHKGLTKKWSDKFYLIKTPTYITEYAENTPVNYMFVWEFDESEFVTTGIPVKSTHIPIATSCFVNSTENEVNTQVTGNGEPYRAFFSYNAETGKYILTARGIQASTIDYQLNKYSKVYFYYPLETPYTLPFNFAISIDAGDQIIFDADLEDIQPYIDEGGIYRWPWVGNVTDFNIDPTVTIFVPRNVEDAMAGMNNVATLFNAESPTDGDATVQGYSWIGSGDGVTDYTVKLQAKLNELHERTDGGTIHLGPGTYPISGSLLVYSNTQIIGDGHTIIEQRSDNTHAFIWNGSDIRMQDLTIKLAGKCTEKTGCIYVNSYNVDDGGRDERYPENRLVERCSVNNVTLIGTYKFSWEGEYAYVSEETSAYRGCGIMCERMYFNYFDCDGLTCRHLYAGVNGGGGGNNYRIYVTESRMAVRGGGGNNIYDINGHTYYSNYGYDGTISATDYMFYAEGAHANIISIAVYDLQWSKGLIYYDGKSQANKHTCTLSPTSLTNSDIGYWDSGFVWVTDYGRGNVETQTIKENYVGIGSQSYGISGIASWNTQFNPSIHNALSGAGVWGTITSNKNWTSNGITLSDVCRYPKETRKTGFGLASAICEVSPNEESPVEIIIDVSNRPIFAHHQGLWIQFDHRYVAEEYTVTYDTTNDGTFDVNARRIARNNNPISYLVEFERPATTIYRIKISITKALQIPNFEYETPGYEDVTVDYNPEGLVGIVNIGMPSNEAYGRAFLGECGGNVYGDIDMHSNTLKNVPDPIDDGDVVNKSYVESLINSGSESSTNKEVSILFIGNSLTQDAITHLPYVLKETAPELNFKFYMWYVGGATLGKQYNDYFIADKGCETFSVCDNTTSWTNTKDVKMSDILRNYKFDVVVLQEYFNWINDYTDTTDFDNCINYIRDNYDKGGFKVATLFPEPRRSDIDTANRVFDITKRGVELILQNTCTESLIPAGIATYRGLFNDLLKGLGNGGNLSSIDNKADGSTATGVHSPEGLPCLMQSYVVALWLFKLLGIPKGIIDSNIRMTSDVHSKLNIPGQNGILVEGTDAENIVAQEVATQAFKEGLDIEKVSMPFASATKVELLWENGSPSSSFGYPGMNVGWTWENIPKFDMYICTCTLRKSSNRETIAGMAREDGLHGKVSVNTGLEQAARNWNINRDGTKLSMSFTTATVTNCKDASIRTNDLTYCIPRRIYGINY